MYKSFYPDSQDATKLAAVEMAPILENKLFMHILEQARMEVYKLAHNEESAKHVFHVMKGFELLEKALKQPITDSAFKNAE